MIEERIEKGKEKGESKDRIVDATPSSSSTTHMIEESIVTVGDEAEEDPVTSIDIEEIEDHMFHRDEPTPSPVCWAIGLSFRALVSIVLLTVVISMILTELFMMSGVSAPVDVPASLGGFMMVDKWIKWRTQRSRQTPFSLQKNILIRICVVTASAVIFGGGFGIFLIGVDRGPSQNIGTLKKDVPVWQMIFFLLITTCSGLFYVLYLRKVIYKLPYPNADTIATLIGSFHDLDANKTTRRQMSTLRYFIIGFMWAICQWIVSKETSCGFSIIPIFGQKAFTKRFSFDFSMTYVGLGMIALRTKIFSMLIGATFSWGIMWPIIQSKKGRWYSAELNDTNLHRLGGYQSY